MVLPIVLSVLAIVPCFFLWAALHELSHYAALKRYRPNATASFKLYPHREYDRFFWARINWEFDGEDITDRELAWVSLAPRVPDLIGALAAPVIAWLVPWPWALPLVVVAAGSLVDLATGSIGRDPESDLKRAARGLETSVWAFRVPGWLLVLGSAAATVLGLAL